MYVLIKLKNSNWFTKKNKQVNVNFKPKSNKLSMYKLQLIHPTKSKADYRLTLSCLML